MTKSNGEDDWKLHQTFDVTEYSCGLKVGDRLRLKRDIHVTDFDGVPTGEVHKAGLIWQVIVGTKSDPVVFLLQPDGHRHTWDDDPTIFDYFDTMM